MTKDELDDRYVTYGWLLATVLAAFALGIALLWQVDDKACDWALTIANNQIDSLKLAAEGCKP